MVRTYYDNVTGETVAIKCVSPITLVNIKKVLREVRVQHFASLTESPHVVPINDFHIPADPPLRAHIVLPRAIFTLRNLLLRWAAPQLDDWPDDCPLSLRLAVRRRDPRLPPLIMAQVLHGLHVLHRGRIMHRDLKPANVLIFGPPASADTSKWHAAVARVCADPAGFGVVAAVADYGWATGSDGRTPTPYQAYRAPELVVDGRNYGTEVDIWAVGVVAAEWFRPVVSEAREMPPTWHLLGASMAEEILFAILGVATMPGGEHAYREILSWLAHLPETATGDDERMQRRRYVLNIIRVALRCCTTARTQHRAALEAVRQLRADHPPAGGEEGGPPYADPAAARATECLQDLRRTYAQLVNDVRRAHPGRFVTTYPGDDVRREDIGPPPPFALDEAAAPPPSAGLSDAMGVLGGAPPAAVEFAGACLRLQHQRRPTAEQALTCRWLADVVRPPRGTDPTGEAAAEWAVRKLGGVRYTDDFDAVATTSQIDNAAADPVRYHAWAEGAMATFSATLHALAADFAAQHRGGPPLDAEERHRLYHPLPAGPAPRPFTPSEAGFTEMGDAIVFPEDGRYAPLPTPDASETESAAPEGEWNAEWDVGVGPPEGPPTPTHIM